MSLESTALVSLLVFVYPHLLNISCVCTSSCLCTCVWIHMQIQGEVRGQGQRSVLAVFLSITPSCGSWNSTLASSCSHLRLALPCLNHLSSLVPTFLLQLWATTGSWVLLPFPSLCHPPEEALRGRGVKWTHRAVSRKSKGLKWSRETWQ